MQYILVHAAERPAPAADRGAGKTDEHFPKQVGCG
jgi:hypothetical protein